jgi:hypothetical protein
VGAVPLLYIISVKYQAWFRRKPLVWTTGTRNTTKNTENTCTGLSYSGRNGGVADITHNMANKTTKNPFFPNG